MFLVRRYQLEPDTDPLRTANCKLGTIMDLALFPLQASRIEINRPRLAPVQTLP